MFSTGLLLFAGALALIGHTTAVTGLVKALMTRRRRNRRADKEAVSYTHLTLPTIYSV